MWGGGVDMVPYLTVYKDRKIIDRICLQGRDTWVAGRHADCDIWVGHASMSRRHLEIQVLHATNELLLVDLQSVHGTRVNGKVVKALGPYVVKQDDVVQMGASTRRYKVDWLPHSVEHCSDEMAIASLHYDRQAKHVEEKVLGHSSPNESKASFRYEILDNNQGSKGTAQRQARREYSSESTENEYRSALQKQDNMESCSRLDVENQENVFRSRQGVRRDNNNGHDENAPSPARAQGQRGGRSELPPRTPVRRLPFSNVQSSTLNARSPQPRPLKKATTLPEKRTPTKFSPVIDKTQLTYTSQVIEEEHEGSTLSKLWLRRCSSAPLPALVTAEGHTIAQSGSKQVEVFQDSTNGNVVEEGNSANVLQDLLVYVSDEDEIYPFDKENCQPHNCEPQHGGAKKSRWNGQDDLLNIHSSHMSTMQQDDRKPFQELQIGPVGSKWAPSNKNVFSPSAVSSPDSDFGSKALGLPRLQRQGTSSEVLDLDLMFGKLELGGGHRRQWHLVVDSNCLLDKDALKSLKQLEGILGTRIIIPKIVVRELDCMKRRTDLGFAARMALKWIKDCMVRMPSWIHVQRSSETLPIQITPPSSPSRNRISSVYRDGGLMSPTNDDHILECALVFHRTVSDGHVALLTGDTALKIKAMAEGLTVDNATPFCESLLSPYSEQFLWSGSMAYLPTAASRGSGTLSTSFTGFDQSYSSQVTSPCSSSKVDTRSQRTLFPGMPTATTSKGHDSFALYMLPVTMPFWCDDNGSDSEHLSSMGPDLA